MQIISLLSIVVLAGFLFKKEASPYARIIIGSVFGAVFFAVWPYVYFYRKIHGFSELQILISYIMLSIMAVGLSVVLVKIKKYEFLIVTVSLVVFVIANIVAQFEDKVIKNSIAIYTDYYNHSTEELKSNESHDDVEGLYLYDSKNFSLLLNDAWIRQTDKGPIFDYFYLIVDGVRVAELRPKCINKQSYAIPDIVMNIQNFFEIQNATTNTKCYQKDKANYACRIDANNQEGKMQRIRWLGINTDFNTEAELDFIVLSERSSLLNEIQRVIDSITFKNPQDDMACLSLTEWM